MELTKRKNREFIPAFEIIEAINKHLPNHDYLMCAGNCPICEFKRELNLEG